MSSESDLAGTLAFAIQTARRAGAIALEYFQTDIAVETKADQSPVTIADRRTEQFLRDQIRNRYPADAIIGEEFGEQVGSSGRRWILDPIDGTQSFVHGVPLFGILIGLEHEGKAVLGVVYLPALDEMVYASRGQGCWWLPAGCQADAAPRRACVSAVAPLADGLLITTSWEYYRQTKRTAVYDRIHGAAKAERGWSDCYGHVLVATGRAEVAIEPLMSIWDAAPFLPILEEAGGTFTDWLGIPTIEGGDAISTNGKVLGEVLSLIQGGPAPEHQGPAY